MAASPSIATFGRGGVHPHGHKQLTRGLEIEPIARPTEVWLPLSQHIGEPATPIVKKGDEVVRGQKIAEGGASGVPLHATISGKIKPFDKRPHPTLVNAESLVIAASPAPTELEFPEDPEWRSLSSADMITRIRDAGLV